MSTFQKKHDDALLPSRFITLHTCSSPTILLKYAPHPERSGYLLMATDLERVLFESFTAPSVPTRLAEIASLPSGPSSKKRKPPTHHSTSEMDAHDTIAQAEEMLGKVAGMMEAFEEVELDIREHDFYDAVLVMRIEGFTWSFNMTELRGRQPLTLLARHLIEPLASVLAYERRIEVRRGPAIGAVLGDEGIIGDLQAVNSEDGSGSGGKSRTRSQKQASREEEEAPEEGDEEEVDMIDEDDMEEGVKDSEQDYPSPSRSPPPKTKSTRHHPKRIDSNTSTSPAPPPPDPPRSEPQPRSPPPTQGVSPFPSPSKASQRTKREREREEEEELEKRREEMRRRMGAGAGGRLGRRRFGK